MARKVVMIDDLSGGLNVKVSSSNLDSSESDELKNVVFDELGSVETAKGNTLLASIGDYPIQGLMSFTDSSSTTQLIAACSGSLYKYSDTPVAFNKISDGIYSTSSSVFMTAYKNKLFMSDGASGNYKYDGTNLYEWGVRAQESDVIPATGSAGLLSGTYDYVVFGETADGAQGNYKPSPAYSVSPFNQQVTVNNIPVYPAITGVKTVYICRNKNAASGLYYEVGSVANGITTFSDNTADADLVSLAPTDLGVPEKFISHIALKGLMFGITKNSSKVYYSNIEEPDNWSSSSYIEVSEGDGLYCTGLSIVGDSLLISKNKGGGAGTLHYLYMPDSTATNWQLQKIDSWVGGQAPKAMVPFSNSIMMMNRFGIWDVSQSSPGIIKPDPISFNIEPLIEQISLSKIDKSCAINWNNKLYISVPYGAVAPNNNMLLIYDYVKGRSNTSRQYGAWSYLSDVNYSNFTIHENNLYAGDAVSGAIYKMETGYNNTGNAIISSYKTAPISGPKSDEGYTKVWRSVWFLVDNVGDWDLQVDAFVDFQVDSNTQVLVDTNPSGVWDGDLLWDIGVWDTQPTYTWTGTDSANATDSTTLGLNKPGYWDSGQWDDFEWDIVKGSKWVRWNMQNCVGKSIAFRFRTTNIDEWFRVKQIKVEYFLKGKLR